MLRQLQGRKWLWLSIATVSLVVFGVVPYIFSSLVLFPAVVCNKAHHIYCETPAELKLKFEDVKIKTQDNLVLDAWFIPADQSTQGIIFVHGHGGSRAEGLRFAKALHAAGYNLLALNLRRNSGGFASMGYYERDNVIAAVDFMIQEKKIPHVSLFGFSMGAATSILAMEEDKRIESAIFSSGYASAMDVLTESAKRDYGIPYFPLLPLVKAYINFRGSMRIESVVPEAKIGNISPRPVMIMHCSADDYVHVQHSSRLFAHAKEPKLLWVPECIKHERIWNEHRQESEARVVEFFTGRSGFTARRRRLL